MDYANICEAGRMKDSPEMGIQVLWQDYTMGTLSLVQPDMNAFQAMINVW
jgi:hypothetical protein